MDIVASILFGFIGTLVFKSHKYTRRVIAVFAVLNILVLIISCVIAMTSMHEPLVWYAVYFLIGFYAAVLTPVKLAIETKSIFE